MIEEDPKPYDLKDFEKISSSLIKEEQRVKRDNETIFWITIISWIPILGVLFIKIFLPFIGCNFFGTKQVVSVDFLMTKEALGLYILPAVQFFYAGLKEDAVSLRVQSFLTGARNLLADNIQDKTLSDSDKQRLKDELINITIEQMKR